jgi:hypothetical protein
LPVTAARSTTSSWGRSPTAAHRNTAAHVDWAQQARMIELVEDGGELKLVLTILDHAGPAAP